MGTLIIIVIVLVTTTLSLTLERLAHLFPARKLNPSPGWLPAVASFLFLVAFFIPNIHISKETSTFQQHFVGGGMYTALLYVYFKRLFNWNLSLIPTLILLFAWTSAFGVASELAEFTLTKLHLARIGTGDTDWDLLANTLGSAAGYLILAIMKLDRNQNL